MALEDASVIKREQENGGQWGVTEDREGKEAVIH